MATIKLANDGDSSSVYELIHILDIKGCDGNLIYEIHNQAISSKREPDPEFVNRSRSFYDIFINPGFVDQWASDDISYAAKVDNVWYFAINTGSNTYLGSGPASTLKLREYCFENKIKILYIENTFNEWITETFKTDPPIIKEESNTILRNETQSYNEVNLIMKRCGDGITRIIDTAKNLIENNYRDLFLAAFHSHTNFIVDGESINRKGRTDLKITDRFLNLPFIFEFKIHNNNTDIKKGLNQITKQYPTVNNTFNGLVFINKKNIGLEKVIDNIQKQISQSELKFTEIKTDGKQHIIVVKHKHQRDININCLLTIFLFDIQQ